MKIKEKKRASLKKLPALLLPNARKKLQLNYRASNVSNRHITQVNNSVSSPKIVPTIQLARSVSPKQKSQNKIQQKLSLKHSNSQSNNISSKTSRNNHPQLVRCSSQYIQTLQPKRKPSAKPITNNSILGRKRKHLKNDSTKETISKNNDTKTQQSTIANQFSAKNDRLLGKVSDLLEIYSFRLKKSQEEKCKLERQNLKLKAKLKHLCI